MSIIILPAKMRELKFNSCPRDWRLSRHHTVVQLRPFLNLFEPHGIMVSRGLRGCPELGLNLPQVTSSRDNFLRFYFQSNGTLNIAINCNYRSNLMHVHGAEFYAQNDAFKLAITHILANWHISINGLEIIECVILVKILAEICQFNENSITILNVSFEEFLLYYP